MNDANDLTEKRHSRLGIVSVIAALLIPVIWISLFANGIILGMRKDSVGNYVGLGGFVVALLAPALHFLGSILGISGCFSKKTKKLFPLIGGGLNALLGVSGLLIIWFIVSNIKWGFR